MLPRMNPRGVSRGLVSVWAIILLTAWFGTSGASAFTTIPDCRGKVSVSTYQANVGSFLESILVGGKGRVYVSLKPDEPEEDRVLLVRFDRPGGPPTVLAEAPEGNPGGLAWAGRKIIWGNIRGGEGADQDPRSVAYLIDPARRTSRLFATGLGQANGIARATNGFIYASNNLGLNLDRITSGGTVDHTWGQVDGANGLVVSEDQRYLYANQTFLQPGSIARIDLRDPSRVVTWWQAGELKNGLFLDGLTRDGRGNLYSSAWGISGIIKIDPKRRACVLADGITAPTSLNFGHPGKKGGPAKLYVSSYPGPVLTINGAEKASFPG